MSGILPAIAVVLILFTDLGAVGRAETSTLLPFGFFGRWGEAGVERDVWAPRGGSTLLLCRITRLETILESQPGARITWLKDDLTLQNRRTYITPEGNLNITKLVRRRGRSSPESDEGVYRCLLSLSNGVQFVVSAPPITLHVAEMGRHVGIAASPSSSVLRGTALRLTCDVPSEPSPSILWQKDQADLPQNDRFTQPTSGVLQITHLQKSDEGIYRCLATNELLNKTRLSANVSISVIDELPHSSSSSSFSSTSTSTYIPPSFLYPGPNLTLNVVEGWYLTLECMATGLPLPTITWKRKAAYARPSDHWEDVSEGGVANALFSGQGNLLLDIVSPHVGGPYLCTASSKDPLTGNVTSISQEMKVVVSLPPQIANLPHNETRLIAQTVRLNCSHQRPHSYPYSPRGSPYSPAPKMAWYKNGIPLQLDTRIELGEENQLIFINAITTDTGVYQCLITNGAGYASAWSYLLVNSQNLTQPPRDLKYFLLSSTSVLLRWTPGESSSQNLAYSVHFSEYIPGSKPTEMQDVVTESPSKTYSNLKPNTEYSFSVRAYSTGASDPSETVYFRTGEDVPIALPEFELSAHSPYTLLVSWSPLPPDKAMGTVDGYKILWKFRSKEYYNLIEVKANVFQHILTDLHPGKAYKVRVMARTKVGYNEGTDWPWKIVTMPEVNLKPLAPMIKVKVQDKGQDTEQGIEVTWERSALDTAPLKGFSLRYRRGTEPWSKELFLPPGQNKYLIPIQEGGSKEAHWYKIKVLGFNEKGKGAPAVEVVSTQGQGKGNGTSSPSPTVDPDNEPSQMPTIEKVRLTPESQTIVRLSWELSPRPPHLTPVSFYTIRQQLLGHEDDYEDDYDYYNTGSSPEPELFRSTTNSISLDKLTPFSTYEFSVRAHLSESVFGVYSPPVMTNTVLINDKEGGATPSERETEPVASPWDLTYEPKDASTIELRWEVSPHREGEGGVSPPSTYQLIYSLNKTLPLDQWRRKEVDGNAVRTTVDGLISNTAYWFRLRGCVDSVCGSYTEPHSASIPAVLPDLYKVYLIVGLTVAVVVIFLVALFTIYILKTRGATHSGPRMAPNTNGTAGSNQHNGGRGIHHGTSRNGATDLNGRGRDYVPMLNSVHTELPTSPLDTKGGYHNARVVSTEFAPSSKCNGVSALRSKDAHYGKTLNSKKRDSEDLEERERLFTPPPPARNGDLVSRVYGAESPPTAPQEDSNGAKPSPLPRSRRAPDVPTSQCAPLLSPPSPQKSSGSSSSPPTPPRPATAAPTGTTGEQ